MFNLTEIWTRENQDESFSNELKRAKVGRTQSSNYIISKLCELSYERAGTVTLQMAPMSEAMVHVQDAECLQAYSSLSH